MLVIRIGSRTLAVAGLLLALLLGVAIGSLRPGALAAADRPPAPAAVTAAPEAQVLPRGVTLEQAMAIINGAMDYARANNYRMSFTVVDAGGHFVAGVRMEGAGLYTPETSRGKALASVAYGIDSNQFAARYEAAPLFWTSVIPLGGRYPLNMGQGALLIRDANGTILGAVGAGGGTSQQDEDAVRAGLQAAGFP
jgi:glc operon protein GlcG